MIRDYIFEKVTANIYPIFSSTASMENFSMKSTADMLKTNVANNYPPSSGKDRQTKIKMRVSAISVSPLSPKINFSPSLEVSLLRQECLFLSS